jgi:tetratricopeptide (TPR) repeat protein
MSERRITFSIGEPWSATAGAKNLRRLRSAATRDGSPFLTLADTNALLRDPAAAEIRATGILESDPADPVAKFLMGGALARRGRGEDAKAILAALSTSQPQMGPVWRELGFVHAKLGEGQAAADALLKALDLNYVDRDVLLALGQAPPSDIAADAHMSAAFQQAATLCAQREFSQALAVLDGILETWPASTLLRALRAISLTAVNRIDAAIAEYEDFIDACDWPGLWLEYARALRSKRDPKAADAIRRAIRLLPSFVEAYVFYASVKPFRWDEELIASARGQLARPDLAPEDRARLHSALGKAYEDLENFDESFANYHKCNEILRGDGNRSAETSANFVRRTKTIFNPVFLRRRAGAGFPAPDAIFIVGMKRSGSTLVEQILSRHSAIEGLGELEELTEVIGRRKGYPQILRELDGRALRAMGEEHIALAGRRRKTGKRHFADKLPHNFGRVGLIHLILPNAKIIDVRRHPLDCGLSCYKHYFPGARLSLSRSDFASAYVDYVKLMAHFDKALPGVVHRVFYEQLVGDLEGEVRRLLKYLGLPFEEDCLRFYDDARYVQTPSADQVRTPLYNSAVDYWRHYEPWLGPMKDKLGYVLQTYPEVPKFYDELHVRMRNPLTLGETGNHYAFFRGLPRRSVAMT